MHPPGHIAAALAMLLLIIPLLFGLTGASDEKGSIRDLEYTLPVGLHGMAVAYLDDDRVLLCGGVNNETNVSAATFIFDPHAGTDALTQVGDLNDPRAGHSVISPSTGGIYVFGGYDLRTIDGQLSAHPVLSCERFDPANNSWMRIGPGMPTPRANHIAVEISRGEILLAGGYDPTTGEGVVSTYKFIVSSKSWIATGKMSRSHVGGSFFPLGEGRIMAAGGSANTTSPASGECEIYDPMTGTWTGTTGMLVPRKGASVISLDADRTLVCGGMTAGNVTSSCELFNYKEGSWSIAAKMPSPLYNCSNASTERYVFLAGGIGNGSADPMIYMYDLERDRWVDTGVRTHGQIDPALATDGDGHLLVFGGTDGKISYNGIQLYTPPPGPEESGIDVQQYLMIALVLAIVGIMLVAFFLQRHETK